MALLLISRGSFSGGVFISQCLSEKTGWRCLTREDLVAAVNAHGELATRITESVATAVHDYGKFSALRRPYKILTLMALLDYAMQGDVAYFGYSGHLLLQGVPHALRVRILAPVERRVALLSDREGLSEEQARERIRQVDEDRRRWTRFMYGRSLRDPELFDLTLNLEHVSFDTACSILIHTAGQAEFTPTEESQAALRNRHTGARVLAELVIDPRTSEIEIDAVAKDGQVTLTGGYLEDSVRDVVLEVAAAVEGVTDVRYQEGYADSFEMMA
jgi:hypothetical protein